MGQAVVVVGAAGSAPLAVVPVDGLAVTGGLVPTAGSWSQESQVPQESGAVRFTPRFPPVPGTAYAVLTGPAGPDGDWKELARVVVPADPRPPSTVVDTIDPGCAQIPENLLRFSVSFSAAMDEGSAAGHVHLRGDDGTDLLGALLPMPPELWDRARRRLTVLLEPGRIKRGLQPNVLAGPPLTGGTTVTFVVDAQLRDARGVRLVAGAERSYRVGEPVRTRVDPGSWVVRWPKAAGDCLVVRFGRPLDRALVLRCLRVRGRDGRLMPGSVSLQQDASGWTFTPALWADDCSLHVDPDLEDLAGNSVRRVFDRDLHHPQDDAVATSGIVLTPNGQVQVQP